MRLCGILKDILIVISSLILWNTPLTVVQVLGYSIALLGLVYYMLGYDRIVGFSSRATGMINEYRAKNRLISILVLILVGFFVVLTVMGLLAVNFAPESIQNLKSWVYYTTAGDDTT
jgi:hypothetical protein